MCATSTECHEGVEGEGGEGEGGREGGSVSPPRNGSGSPAVPKGSASVERVFFDTCCEN